MKQILLVEDDHDIAALLRLNLEDEGYAITHEPDGGNALQRLEKQPWDAVILDLMLPNVDGLEICRRIRQMTRYLPGDHHQRPQQRNRSHHRAGNRRR